MVLSVLGRPWWLSLAGVGVLVLALAVVRVSVRRGRARTAAAPRRPRPAPERRHTHQGRPSTSEDRQHAPGPAAAPAARADAHRPAARRVSLFDLEATEPATRSAAPAPTTPQDRADDSRTAAPPPAAGSGVATATGHPGVATSGTWEPVPVPPPTYTLKARASRPSATQLPADGREMALDVELEDLPPVRALG